MRAIQVTLTTCVLLVLSLGADTQAITVSGDVRNEAGAPLDSTVLRIEGTASSTFTNDQGRYSLIVPDSSFRATIVVSVQYVGASTERFLVSVSDSSIRRDFQLKTCGMSIRDPGDPPERFAKLPPRAALSRAAGIKNLRDERRSPGLSEIRVWIWRDDQSPFDLYRFTKRSDAINGEHVSSIWGAHRCLHDVPANTVCGQPSASGTIPNVGDLYICRSLEQDRVNWSSLWSSLQASAMPLLRAGQRGSHIDSQRHPHYMTVEVKDGSSYRSGSFELQSGADTSTTTAAERLAASLARIP